MSMKHTVNFFIFLFFTFPFYTSCVFSNRTIYGNHQLVNEKIAINNYEKVILNLPGEVFYQQFSDSAPYLQIHTDENIFNVLDVRVKDDQLIIDVKKDSIISPSKLTIYTCSHGLDHVTINGSGEIRLKGEVNANDLSLNIMGSGNLLADSLLCNKLTVKIIGAGNVNLTGASNESLFTITGAGNIEAFNYFLQELNCKITGAGNIEAFVNDKLDVQIIGSGNLSYRGDPKPINKIITGSGTVNAVN